MPRTLSVLTFSVLLSCRLLNCHGAAVATAADAAARRTAPIVLPLNSPYLSALFDQEGSPSADEPPGDEPPWPSSSRQQTPPEEREPENTPHAEASTAETPEEGAPASEQGNEDSRPEPAEGGGGEEPAGSKPKPRPKLTPAMAALRDRVRRTLAGFQGQRLNTRENTATELMHYCLAFGCNSEVHLGGPSGRKVNGVTCLCWNYPCAGHEPLLKCQQRIAARIGYGTQEHPSQLLAVLALSRVPPDYPVRVGQDVRSVADLVAHEKLGCRRGTDMSLKLICLAYYVEEPTWQNDLQEQWSIERILQEELKRPIVGAVDGGTNRLMGISYALGRRAKANQPIKGQFARAQRFINDFQEFALQIQNSDGSWSPRFFAARGIGRNTAAQLRSTGHILQWLALSLPRHQLDDPRVVRSVECVQRLLSDGRYRHNVRSLSTREIGSVMHALHALAVYDRRCFGSPAAQESS